MSITRVREKLAGVGIHRTDQQANLHLLQCLTSDFEVDKKILQYAPNLTPTMIEDRLRITYWELEGSKKKVVYMFLSRLVAVGQVDTGISPPPDTARAAEVIWRELVLRHTRKTPKVRRELADIRGRRKVFLGEVHDFSDLY